MTQDLTPVDAVRKRSGMYVGDTDDGTGLLHMLMEVVGNSIDQHLAGRCSRIAITVQADATTVVEDDGPGLPPNGGDGLPPLDILLSRISNRPTVDGHRPHVHLAFGVGLFVANALSERFEVRSIRAGEESTIAYERGNLVEKLSVKASTSSSGTTIRFRPDRTIFKHRRMPRGLLTRQLEDLSFLLPSLALSWTVDGDNVAAGGIAARIAVEIGCDLDEVASHAGSYSTPAHPVDASVAIAWRGYGAPWIESFANFRRTSDHGAHVDGFLDGMRRFVGRRRSLRDAGLTAVVHVVLADVQTGFADQKSSRVSRDPSSGRGCHRGRTRGVGRASPRSRREDRRRKAAPHSRQEPIEIHAYTSPSGRCTTRTCSMTRSSNRWYAIPNRGLSTRGL